MDRDKNRLVREAARGWLEIEITGLHTEHLLNLALRQGLELYHIRRFGEQKLKVRLALADIYQLRPLLNASRCRFRVLHRGGWPFWLAHGWRRAGLIFGATLAALGFFLICSFIWVVRVESPYPLSAAQYQRVLALAGHQGLAPGVFALGLDWLKISRDIAAEASDLVFVQAERQGVIGYIYVVRRVDVRGEEAPAPPGDIVARCDGLIEEILVRSGTMAVEPGATVKAGDVLVYGWDGAREVAASALITARVWGEGEGEWPLIERGLRPSGQSASRLSLRFGRDMAAVQGQKESPYTHFNQDTQVYGAFLWRNIKLPVELVWDTWYEQEDYVTSYSKEQALYHATQKAISRAVAQLPPRCDLLLQQTLENPATPDQVSVRVIWEARADIGAFRPLL